MLNITEHKVLDESGINKNIELVKGKRCVVVAPSGYLKGRGGKSGEFIESFDCVVKCTSTSQIDDPNNELGRRCDIWYGLPHYPAVPWSVSFDALRQQSVKIMRFQPKLDRYVEVWDESVNWFLQANKQQQFDWVESSAELYEDLINQLECIPFTGVFAVIELLHQGAKEVYAYGHDFYQTGYFGDEASTRCEGSEWHKLEPQMALFWDLLQNEPRFNCDDNLKQLLCSKFGGEDEISEQIQNLLSSDLNHFFGISSESILMFRTCNINKFKPLLKVIEDKFSDDDIDVLCQSSFTRELADYKSKIIDYGRDSAFQLELAKQLPDLRSKQYSSCLIPYNGLEILTYHQVFLIARELGIENVYLISLRGALSKVNNLSDICTKIQKYLSIRLEYKMLSDKFDRRNCL